MVLVAAVISALSIQACCQYLLSNHLDPHLYAVFSEEACFDALHICFCTYIQYA